jgi:cytochrome P450 family 710 subfamily A protein
MQVGLCSHFLLGNFVLFVRDSEISHKIFANVRPDAFQLVGHPLGSKLFGKDNLIFMFGQEHKDLRASLAPLFTLKALGIYISIQEKTVRKHIATWLASAEKSNDPVQLRLLIRDMNLETSQNAFVGPYLTPEQRQQFNYDYNLFNQGLMSLPVSLPGFAFHAAKKAVPRLIATLTSCAKASKVRMMAEEEPACLIDFWIVEVLKQIREAEEAGAPMPRHTSDPEIGYHVFDFLFAAQDASTSSITWAATLLESHPDMLEKVRQEQKFLQHESPTGLTPELLRKMKYTEMVVKEVLRYCNLFSCSFNHTHNNILS